MYMRKQFHFYYGTGLITCQGNTALFARSFLHQPHAAQQENPARQCDGGKQGCQHNDTCGKFSVVSHIGRHDITRNRRRRAQHNQDGDQLRVLQAERNGKRQKDRRQKDQFDCGCPERRFDFCQRLGSLKSGADNETLSIILSGMVGISMRSKENGSPSTMPIIIGFLSTLMHALRIAPVPCCPPLAENVKIMTE